MPLLHPARLLPVLAASALLAALASPAAAHNGYPGAAHTEPAGAAYAQLPLAFEPNRGQAATDIDFVARGQGYTIALNGTSASLGLGDTAVRMAILGGRTPADAAGTPLEVLPGRVNYLVGNDPDAWRTDIPTYGRVQYESVYPGIDLAYYGQHGQLEYDFIVGPGASPEPIRLEFDTVDNLELDAQGDLLLRTAAGDLRQPTPADDLSAGGWSATSGGRRLRPHRGSDRQLHGRGVRPPIAPGHRSGAALFDLPGR
jgi:hypothetical protein